MIIGQPTIPNCGLGVATGIALAAAEISAVGAGAGVGIDTVEVSEDGIGSA